ncbi:MAG: 3-isopropylmalate dehydratase small subunit [Holophagales bacterium]|nr:3-isopropylmalate dehydratase small subunit [Holophagales bacterium]MYD23274.1 3-isopropylmalate dehydratase small subunit [Holophagales bacterium]MYI33078.1 3-isopropylmalate dehydratase small subunit [Holophagales bacterium]
MAPLPIQNIDTDQIIPASYLKVTDRSGLASGLFSRWRYRDGDPEGEPVSDFVLNRAEHGAARILLAGDNFGCGSSREHAPWALVGYGFRAVISTSFADIFRSNALKNGLLVVPVAEDVSAALFDAVAADPATEVTIDLEARTLSLPDGGETNFEVDPFARRCLLDGTDQLGYLLNQAPAIQAFEAANPARLDTRSG